MVVMNLQPCTSIGINSYVYDIFKSSVKLFPWRRTYLSRHIVLISLDSIVCPQELPTMLKLSLDQYVVGDCMGVNNQHQ